MPNSKPSIRKRFIEQRKSANETQSAAFATNRHIIANTERLLEQILAQPSSCQGLSSPRRRGSRKKLKLDPRLRGDDKLTELRRGSDKLSRHLRTDNKTHCIGLYSALPYEVQLDSLMDWLRKRGISYALPKITCLDEKRMSFVALDVSSSSQWDESSQLRHPTKRGHFGIEEPTTGSEVEPTILLVPLVAADSHGHRLGHGHGYYDRYIANLRKKQPKLVTVGICHEHQLYEGKLPAEAHDQALDFIVTEKQIYECGEATCRL